MLANTRADVAPDRRRRVAPLTTVLSALVALVVAALPPLAAPAAASSNGLPWLATSGNRVVVAGTDASPVRLLLCPTDARPALDEIGLCSKPVSLQRASATDPAPDASSGSSAQLPPAGGYFTLQPVGSWAILPTDAQAADRVRRSSWEPRPDNAIANRTRPSGLALGSHGGVAARWNEWLLPRVTGNFTGTTDEIIQWAAIKWGLPDDLLRAQVLTESSWYQGRLDAAGRPVPDMGFGDYTWDQSKCASGYTAPCPHSFGILQIRNASYHPGAYPHSHLSTAFNADYAGALLRGCFEGWETWLRTSGGAGGTASTYAAGDLDGCLGRWYAGSWHTADASRYIATVRRHEAAKAWLAPSF